MNQPEALRLADALDECKYVDVYRCKQAAAELRRLAALAQQAHTDDLNQRIKLYVGSRLGLPQPAEPQTTHSAECWRWHHKCAIAEVERLRAALAQQAEPVEPVAWRYQDARGNYRYRGYVQGFDKEYSLLKPVPLYTAPPPRKPLTQEEIPALAEKAWKPSVYCDAEALLGTDGLVALVRAVERAHGIKERP